MEKFMDLICVECKCSYQKPSIYKEYYIESNFNIFYEWSLMYCDKCRKERELFALNQLETISDMLSKNKQD